MSEVWVDATAWPPPCTTAPSACGSNRRTWARAAANHGPLSLPPKQNTGHRMVAASCASKRHESSAGTSDSKNLVEALNALRRR